MKKQTEINFTKAALQELPIPPKGKIKFHDTKEKGLSLYVTATGHKSFMIRRRIKGQQKEIILGHFPDMSVELARKEAQKMKGQLAEGKNPCEEKEKPASEKTFGEAYEIHMNRYARAEYKPSALKDIEKRMKKVLPYWVKRGLSSTR